MEEAGESFPLPRDVVVDSRTKADKIRKLLRSDLVGMRPYSSPQLVAKVRLNANESPFAPSTEWLRAFLEAVELIKFNRYPDRAAQELRIGLARLHKVLPEQVFCANGSNEVIQSLLLAYGGPGRQVAVFEPTYTMYQRIAKVTFTEVVKGVRGDDLRLNPSVVDELFNKFSPSVVLLCSPNNPTGVPENEETVAYLLQKAPGLVVVDEAYGQFNKWSALCLFGNHPNSEQLAVVRTFSKTWAMAANRLGYLIGSEELVASLELVTLPYHLDAVKQIAGALALEFRQEMESVVETIIDERERVQRRLAELPVEYWPSSANFILFRPLEHDSGTVWQRLLDRSVLIRDCSNWPGATGCLRVTVGTREENDAFLQALADSL